MADKTNHEVLVRELVQKFPAICRNKNATISINQAIQLRSQGYSWPKVARILSTRAGRYPPFHGRSVQNAVKRSGRWEEITK